VPMAGFPQRDFTVNLQVVLSKAHPIPGCNYAILYN
jgi:hypothetical protein